MSLESHFYQFIFDLSKLMIILADKQICEKSRRSMGQPDQANKFPRRDKSRSNGSRLDRWTGFLEVYLSCLKFLS